MTEFENNKREKEVIQFANNLQTEFPQFQEDQTIKIHVCAYQINTTGKYPFLQYFLLKNLPEHELTFPTFDYIYTESEPIINVVEVILNKIFDSYEKPKSLFQYKGFVCTKNNDDSEYYVFYDCSVYEIDRQLLYKRNDIWLVLIDEIMNDQLTCNIFSSSELVINFFSLFSEFIYLKNKDNEPYEIPIVAYTGCYYKSLDFISTFGVSPNPFYVFTSYQKSFDLGGWSKTHLPEIKHGKCITESDEGKYIRGGIIRFAIFPGNMILEKVTNFDENIDSYFNIEDDIPYWVLKDYEQQTSLSYHFIDKTTLGKLWSSEDNYSIC
jgi:hypothetical protein